MHISKKLSATIAQRAFSPWETTTSSPRRNFALVLDCEAECSDALVQFVSKHIPGKHVILVDSSEVKQALQSVGERATQTSEIVRIDSDEEIELYDSALRIATDIERSFDDVRYKNIPVYAGMKATFINSLVLVNTINVVLSKLEHETTSESIVLAVSGHAYPYLAVTDLARDRGFRVLPVLACSNRGVRKSLRPMAMRLFALIRRSKTLLSRASPTRVHERLVFASGKKEITTLFHLGTNEYDLYMRPVYPVLAQFRRSGESFFVMSSDPRVQKRLQSMKISVLRLNELSAAPDREQQEVLRVVSRRFKQISQALSTHHEPLRFILPCFAEHALHRSTLGALRSIEIFREVVSGLRPRSIFVMPDTTDMSALLCKVAEEFGVPTFTTLAASPGRSFRSRGEYFCDYIAVDGTDSLRDLSMAGYNRSRLVLVGNPALDGNIGRPKVQDRLYVSRFAPLDFAKHVFLIATSRFDPKEHVWMSLMIRILQERGDSEVVVKIHPLYHAADYQQLVNECSGLRFFVVEEAEIYPLLNVADVVVTDYSHMGKDALILDKPLLTVNLTDRQFPANRYAEDGVAVHVSSIEETAVAIDRILTDKKLLLRLEESRRKTIDNYNYRNDGQASRRLYELLTKPGDLVTSAEHLQL